MKRVLRHAQALRGSIHAFDERCFAAVGGCYQGERRVTGRSHQHRLQQSIDADLLARFEEYPRAVGLLGGSGTLSISPRLNLLLRISPSNT